MRGISNRYGAKSRAPHPDLVIAELAERQHGVVTRWQLLGPAPRALAELDDAPPTRSELERRFLDLVRSASLPSPVTNGLVDSYEVDFHWPDARLIVETDGRETHATPLAFERDRERDLELTLAGWRVIRITWRQLRDAPERIVALLRAHLRGCL